MDFKPELVHGIYNFGFMHPSDIQSLAIQPIKEGRCVIAQAQSGTGKTGAFSIGILDIIDLSEKETQALVLAPTRELAEQIYWFFVEIGQRMKGLEIALFKGGVSVCEDERRAMSLPHVAISTPGRALHLIEKGFLRCENLKTVCLDEADKLLGEDFFDEIQKIFSFLNPDIQVLLFSATYTRDAFRTIGGFMRDPVKILVKTEELTLEGIKQFYVQTEQMDMKLDTLLDIYGQMSIQKAIIFANSKAQVDEIQATFENAGFGVAPIHSGFDQPARDATMKDFRKGMSRVLVATDLLARGIDVQQITLVINFELPQDMEQYLHRIGRSARYGRKGVAINLCDRQEYQQMQEIQEFYHTKIEELPGNFAEFVKEANNSV
jgi:translation initiation factor 4A